MFGNYLVTALRNIARHMTSGEIEAVAKYYEAQP